jgi:hypothetical protein
MAPTRDLLARSPAVIEASVRTVLRGAWGSALTALAMLTPWLARAGMPIVLSQPSPEHERAAAKLVAELRTDGYSVRWLSYPASEPCTDRDARDRSPVAGLWIELGPATQPGNVTASICYVPGVGTSDQTKVSAPIDDPERLAIITVEAINGLLSGPHALPNATRKPVEDAIAESPPSTFRSLVFVGGAAVIDATGSGPVIGTQIGLVSSFNRRWAFGVDAFLPAVAATETGADRTLDVRSAWLRLSIRHSWPVGNAELVASVASGPALVWASGQPLPPLIGSTRIAITAVVSAGGAFVYPSHGPFALYLETNASRLIPSVKLKMDSSSTRSFGQILIDATAGVGLSWR